MKKFVIKAFLLVFSCISLFAGFSYAATIAFNEVGYSNSCSEYTGETKYFNYYLTNGTYTTNPYDTFTASSHDAIQILKNGSTDVTYVGLWRGAGFVNGCSDWKSSSTIAKVGVPGTLVLFNNNGCTFKKPSNTYVKTSSTSIDAQIQFTIGYVSKGVSNQLTLPAGQKLYYKLPNDNFRTCYEGGNQVSDWNQCNPSPAYPISYVRQHTGECINYRIFRCGDGLLNGYNGSTNYNNGTVVEQCDPNDSSHAGRGNGGCSDTCQPINNAQSPLCSTTYNNQTQYTSNGNNWLNQNTPGLCSIGFVSNFQYSWNPGHSRHFTWNCNNDGQSTDCLAYQQWCGDGKVETNHGETCDPADPTHSGWNNNGYTCNAQCQLVIDPNNQPQCNSQYNGTHYTNQTAYPYINGGTPGLCSVGTVTNFTGRWQGYGHTAHYTWTCSNSAGNVNCTANQNWCGDGLVGNGETCDPNDPTHSGWNNNGYTCNAQCQLVIDPNNQPQCNSQYNGTHYTNQTAYPYINGGTPGLCSVGTVTNFTGRWQGYGHTAHYTWTCSNSAGNVNCTANQNWCGDGLVGNGEACDPNDPTHSGWNGNGYTCNSSCELIQPHLTIQKELLTAGDMTAGSTVAYKITLTNTGDATYYNAYILDILPNAIQYQTSSIQNISNYLFEEGTTGSNEHYIMYYDFNLAAGQSAIVYLTGILKQGFNFNQTTNCAMTSGAIDCEDFPLSPIPYIQKYQKIGNDTNPNSNGWTTGLLTVELGQYISYRIDFGNMGNTAATGEVKDILPNCVQYVSATLVGANGAGPTYYPNVHTVRFTNIPLAAGQTAHMMVVGKIKQEDGCQNVYSYLNTGAFHFIHAHWQNSTVLAERPNTTDVEITKTVDKTIVESGDVVTYTITYKNKGPEILQSYTIVDYWPNDKLQFSGVVSPATPTPIRVSDSIVKREFNTPLGVNEQRQIIIQGIVR